MLQRLSFKKISTGFYSSICITVALFIFLFNPLTAEAITTNECTAGGGTVVRHESNSAGTTYTCSGGNSTVSGQTVVDGDLASGAPSSNAPTRRFDCGLTDFVTLPCLTELIYNLLFLPVTLGLASAGNFLDGVISVTIVGFAEIVDPASGPNGIAVAWGLIRDVLNMSLIFMLLYTGIRTILGVGGYQKLIKSVVIAGLFINFSFFFTSILIDLSNVVTVEVYESIKNLGDVAAENESGILFGGISGAFMSGLRFEAAEIRDPVQNLFQFIFGFITMLIAAYVFLAMGLMLLIRFILLIILLITSPVALFGDILPQLGQWSKKWREALMGQLIFAPVFMLMMLVIVVIINSGGFQGGIGKDVGLPLTQGEDSGFIAGTIRFLIQYATVIGLMVAALIIAKTTSSSAAKGLMSWATKTAGAVTLGAGAWAATNTLGRGGRAMSESGTFNRWAASRNPLARIAGSGLVGGGKKLGNASLDARGLLGDTGAGKAGEGYIKRREAAAKRQKEYTDRMVGKESLADKKERERLARDIASSTPEQQDLQKKKADLQEQINREQSIIDSGLTTDSQKGEAENKRDRLRGELQPINEALGGITAKQERLEALEKRSPSVAAEEAADARKAVAATAGAISAAEVGEVVAAIKDMKGKTVEQQRAIRDGLDAGQQEYLKALQRLIAIEETQKAQKKAQEQYYGSVNANEWLSGSIRDNADRIRKGKSKEQTLVEAVQALEIDKPKPEEPAAPPPPQPTPPPNPTPGPGPTTP